jgi:hypothetical protein
LAEGISLEASAREAKATIQFIRKVIILFFSGVGGLFNLSETDNQVTGIRRLPK